MSTVQILRGHKPAQFPQIPEPGSSSRDAAGAAEPEKELEKGQNNISPSARPFWLMDCWWISIKYEILC